MSERSGLEPSKSLLRSLPSTRSSNSSSSATLSSKSGQEVGSTEYSVSSSLARLLVQLVLRVMVSSPDLPSLSPASKMTLKRYLNIVSYGGGAAFLKSAEPALQIRMWLGGSDIFELTLIVESDGDSRKSMTSDSRLRIRTALRLVSKFRTPSE